MASLLACLSLCHPYPSSFLPDYEPPPPILPGRSPAPRVPEASPGQSPLPEKERYPDEKSVLSPGHGDLHEHASLRLDDVPPVRAPRGHSLLHLVRPHRRLRHRPLPIHPSYYAARRRLQSELPYFFNFWDISGNPGDVCLFQCCQGGGRGEREQWHPAGPSYAWIRPAVLRGWAGLGS